MNRFLGGMLIGYLKSENGSLGPGLNLKSRIRLSSRMTLRWISDHGTAGFNSFYHAPSARLPFWSDSLLAGGGLTFVDLCSRTFSIPTDANGLNTLAR